MTVMSLVGLFGVTCYYRINGWPRLQSAKGGRAAAETSSDWDYPFGNSFLDRDTLAPAKSADNVTRRCCLSETPALSSITHASRRLPQAMQVRFQRRCFRLMSDVHRFRM
jgi:hypothetical protein